MTDTEQGKPSPEQLDCRLLYAADNGHTETVRALLAAGANVHAKDDWALRLAGHTETVKVLLAAGADVHAKDDFALIFTTIHGHTETARALIRHVFAPNSWRGKSRAEIEAQANAIYNKINHNSWVPVDPEHLRQAATLLFDYATQCWHQVRPIPHLNISPYPARARPL